MKYKIEINVSFENKQDAETLLNYIESIKDLIYKPTQKEIEPVERYVRYHECSHDENASIPCGNYLFIDFNKEKTNHAL